MKYRIVQYIDGDFIVTQPTDIVAWANVAGVTITGYNANPAQRAELQGQPRLSGFCGPMWDGNGVIRYEDTAAYRTLSA